MLCLNVLLILFSFLKKIIVKTFYRTRNSTRWLGLATRALDSLYKLAEQANVTKHSAVCLSKRLKHTHTHRTTSVPAFPVKLWFVLYRLYCVLIYDSIIFILQLCVDLGSTECISSAFKSDGNLNFLLNLQQLDCQIMEACTYLCLKHQAPNSYPVQMKLIIHYLVWRKRPDFLLVAIYIDMQCCQLCVFK